mmetsp:Transcript_133319/g.345016  ORF Transcript_133319/g.345016 Transcript_133319/m.345016 type:complete len:266 (+) Transcript_133319:1636-2433(+)
MHRHWNAAHKVAKQPFRLCWTYQHRQLEHSGRHGQCDHELLRRGPIGRAIDGYQGLRQGSRGFGPRREHNFQHLGAPAAKRHIQRHRGPCLPVLRFGGPGMDLAGLHRVGGVRRSHRVLVQSLEFLHRGVRDNRIYIGGSGPQCGHVCECQRFRPRLPYGNYLRRRVVVFWSRNYPLVHLPHLHRHYLVRSEAVTGAAQVLRVVPGGVVGEAGDAKGIAKGSERRFAEPQLAEDDDGRAEIRPVTCRCAGNVARAEDTLRHGCKV